MSTQDRTPKAWFSIRALRPYRGPEPAFFDRADFPWVVDVERAWPVFLRELEYWLADQRQGKRYFRGDMVTGGDWRTVPLMTWGLKYHRTLRHFPATMAALKGVPGLVSVAFNVLEPGAEIKPHFGDTNAVVRCHLGLRVPGTLPELGIQVGDHYASWEQGRLLLFCDGYQHSAWNHTKEPRQILLIDVLRPEFRSHRRRVCGMVLGSLALQAMLSKLGALAVPPAWLRPPLHIVHFFAALSAMALAPVYNAVGRRRHRK